MRIGILDAIKVLKQGEPKGTLEEIALKYKSTVPEIDSMAKERAVKVMMTAVPMEANKRKDEHGLMHTYCPECKEDITLWSDGWSFCPYCGQAVIMSEEEKAE